LDPLGYKCALCGGAPGVRYEQCYVTEDTKMKLLAHAEELTTFGVTLEEHDVIQKSVGDVAGCLGLAIAVAESLDSGVLRKLILYLQKLEIPKNEILRLRLDEPEVITDILSIEESNDSHLKE
jgi:hypothetical protein